MFVNKINTYSLPSTKIFALTIILVANILSPALVFADSIKLSGTGASLASMKLVAAEFQKTSQDIEVEVVEPGMGSGGSIKALSSGFLDLAISARPLKKEEEASGLTIQAFARTPFIFVAAKNNSAAIGFSTNELVDIYSGKSLFWPDGNRIRLVMRPSTDTDTIALKNISPEMSKAVVVALSVDGIEFPDTDQVSADAVARTYGGLGTSTLGLIIAENRPLKPLAVNGVMPSIDTMLSGAYPYVRPIYYVLGPNPSESTRRFVEFLTSDTAKQILAEVGFSTPPS